MKLVFIFINILKRNDIVNLLYWLQSNCASWRSLHKTKKIYAVVVSNFVKRSPCCYITKELLKTSCMSVGLKKKSDRQPDSYSASQSNCNLQITKIVLNLDWIINFICTQILWKKIVPLNSSFNLPLISSLYLPQTYSVTR